MTEINTSLRERLISWEKLRLIYNILMLLGGIPIAIFIYKGIHELPSHYDTLKHSFTIGRVIVDCVLFGLMANLCYTFGPMLEIYVTAFITKNIGKKFRYTIFIIGTFFSMAIQLAVWFTYSVFLAFELS